MERLVQIPNVFFVLVVIVIFVGVFLPCIYSGAPWVTESTNTKKLLTVICHSLFHFNSSTITVPTLLFHHHCSTITFPPHCSPITVPPHSSTFTVPPLLFHYHCYTLTVQPSLHHHYCSTSLFHFDSSTITVPPSLFHHYYST